MYFSIPDEIEEGICWTDLFYLLLFGEFVFRAFSRVDDEHHGDPDEHSDDSGGGVVNYGSHTHLP